MLPPGSKGCQMSLGRSLENGGIFLQTQKSLNQLLAYPSQFLILP